MGGVWYQHLYVEYSTLLFSFEFSYPGTTIAFKLSLYALSAEGPLYIYSSV